MKCKYLKELRNYRKVCTHRNNPDHRYHGTRRTLKSKRCNKELCPLNFKELSKQKDL